MKATGTCDRECSAKHSGKWNYVFFVLFISWLIYWIVFILKLKAISSTCKVMFFRGTVPDVYSGVAFWRAQCSTTRGSAFPLWTEWHMPLKTCPTLRSVTRRHLSRMSTAPHANVNTCPIPYALWVTEYMLNDVLHNPRNTTNGYSICVRTSLLCNGKL